MTQGRRSPLAQFALWCAIGVLVTLLLLPFRTSLDKAYVALTFLLLVLGASSMAGHRVGLGIAFASFLAFDWFFLPPYNTLVLNNPLDWFVLVSFLIVSVVAAQLLHRLQREAALAQDRAAAAMHADALREADRLKNALLASVSHDLRTPLTTIKALAHDLVQVDARAITIEEEADRLNRMVADLLDLSRVQGGAALTGIAINAVDDLVGAALQRVSGALAHRVIAAELADGGTMLVGRFDLAASLRILVNLLENADKYSPPDAPIDLTALRHGDWIEITVADRGSGVCEAERDRIFEPFYRPPSAPSDARGAGLGLAIARGLAQAQGASLRYDARPGGGSRFVLALPAADLPADAIS